jgi:flagellar hook-associated protein 1 FlgK
MSGMSLSSLGVKALAANYAALQTTGHNIANANVAGYSRQQVELSTTAGQYNGGSFFGRGVDVASVTRLHNEFVTGEAARSASVAAMDSARLSHLNGLESIFRTGEQGLGNAVGAFLNSISDMASSPSDTAVRQVVLARAVDMAGRFNEAGQALDTLQANVTSELKVGVAAVNGLSQSIAEVNRKIAAVNGRGQQPNDLLDQRDRLIAQISQYVQVSRIAASDGSVGVFAAGGQSLVLGDRATPLVLMPDPSDPRRSAVGLQSGTKPMLLEAGTLGGGSLAGLLLYQNADLSEGRALVGRMAAVVGLAVNAQQQRGINLLGSSPTPAIFGLGAPQAVPSTSNATDASGALMGQVSLSYTGDPSALRASDYTLREDPAIAGNWMITRLVDGQPSTDAADSLSFNGTSASFQGVKVTFGLPPPQAGDSFLLQTVSRAANGMQALLRDPRDLAAASPLVAAVAATNTGTAATAGLQVTATTLPFPGMTTRLTFVDNAAADPLNPVAYTYTILAADGSLVGGNATPRPWIAGTSIPGNSGDINGFSLQLSGVPKPGDSIDIAPTSVAALQTNNGNALSMLALRDMGLMDGKTPSDAYAQALADIGSRVQTASSASDISTAVADQSEQARSSTSGVNLDEEAARLIQFQQSYQAAAKMLQVAQSLFDTLLSTTSR